MNTYEQIVRELAESAPFPSRAYDLGPCRFCDVLDHEEHEPECLWLRAKRAVEFKDTGGVVHAMYDRESGRFPCCARAYDEVGVADRMTLDPVACPVTCGMEQAETNDERTLHVTVNSSGDWLLEKDGEGTPTRVAVMW